MTPACFNTRRDDEIQLTNGPEYESHVASIVLSKNFDGLFTDRGKVYFNLGYAFTDSNNFRNVGSSTATSSYDITAAFDRQNPAISTSNFETRHNITFALNLREEFLEDYSTQLGFVFVAREGRPYSFTFDGGGVFNDSASGTDNALLYIPTGPNDPNIAPPIVNAAGVRTGGSDPAAVTQLVDYISGFDCARPFIGRSIARNTCRNDWFYDLDLRFSQELPGPLHAFGLTNDRFKLFADFENFLNLLDDGANVFRTRDQFVDVVDGGVDAQGRYIITGFNPDDQNDIQTSSSVWKIQLGVRYEF